jgi:hypothetical protein
MGLITKGREKKKVVLGKGPAFNYSKYGTIFGIVSIIFLLSGYLLLFIGFLLEKIFLSLGFKSSIAYGLIFLSSVLKYYTLPISIIFLLITLIFGVISFIKTHKKTALIIGIITIILLVIHLSYSIYSEKTLSEFEPPAGSEHSKQCLNIYSDCINNQLSEKTNTINGLPTAEGSLCLDEQRECFVKFQNEGLIPEETIDLDKLNKKMTELVRGGTIQNWQIVENGKTLIIWVNVDLDIDWLNINYVEREEKLKPILKKMIVRYRSTQRVGLSELNEAFARYVKNRYATNTCVELRNSDGALIAADCNRSLPEDDASSYWLKRKELIIKPQ